MMGHPVLRGLFWISCLVLLGYGIESLQLGSMMEKSWIDNEVRNHGFHGTLLLFGVGVLYTAIGLPRQILSFFAGYAFGVIFGGVLALAATSAGCMVTYYVAQLLGRDLITRLLHSRLEKIDRFVADHTLRMTLVIRLLPVGSNIATNIAAGVTSVRAVPFFTGSALGYIPQTLVFSLIGNGVTVNPMLQIGSGIVLFLISSMIGISLYRHFQNNIKQMHEKDSQFPGDGSPDSGQYEHDGNPSSRAS